MKTLTLSISTKKGESQSLRFLVVQSRPYPRIGSHGSVLEWENHDGIFPRFSEAARGIGETFDCYLLSSNAPAEIPADFNRKVFAGFTEYKGTTASPGTMKLRGADLGEMTIRFEVNPNHPRIFVRGFESPSAGERKAIYALLVPKLLEFIQSNKADLKADAVELILERMRDEVATKRAELEKLEAKISEAKF